MSDELKPYDVLFLCTGNSARSIMAEAILAQRGGVRFRAYSAGSEPKGEVHPGAIARLEAAGLRTDGLRSKSWDEFGGDGAPKLDFVFTVCDNARNERCPLWPGQPISAHWGVEDPAAAPPEEQARVFRRVFIEIERRIALFVELPIPSLSRLGLQTRLDDIGKS